MHCYVSFMMAERIISESLTSFFMSIYSATTSVMALIGLLINECNLCNDYFSPSETASKLITKYISIVIVVLLLVLNNYSGIIVNTFSPPTCEPDRHSLLLSFLCLQLLSLIFIKEVIHRLFYFSVSAGAVK